MKKKLFFYSTILILTTNIAAMHKYINQQQKSKTRQKKHYHAPHKHNQNTYNQTICTCPDCLKPNRCKVIKFITRKWKEAQKLRRKGNIEKSTKILYDCVAYQNYMPRIRYVACLYIADDLKCCKKRLDLHASNAQIIKECLYTLLNYADQETLSPWIIGQTQMIKGQLYDKKLKEKHNQKTIKKYTKKFINSMEQARKEFALSLKTNDTNKISDKKNYLYCTLKLADYFTFYIFDNYKKVDIKIIDKQKEKAISYFTELLSCESYCNNPEIIHNKIQGCLHLANLYRHPVCKKAKESLILYKKT